jgi:hypothetical protein
MIGPTDLLHPSPASHFKTFQTFLIYEVLFTVRNVSQFLTHNTITVVAEFPQFLICLERIKTTVYSRI